MTKRHYVIVSELDDELMSDRQRDLLAVLDQAGRERAMRASFEGVFPNLTILNVAESEAIDVRLG